MTLGYGNIPHTSTIG